MFETPEKYTYFHRVAAPDKLLSNPYFPHLLQKVKGHSGVKELHYKALYEKLVPDFAAFVQAIPLRSKGKPGTLLAYSLEHAAKALEAYHKESKKDFDIRFGYALFTAGLFKDLGKVIGQQRIGLCNTEGEFVEDWLPHTGPMKEEDYYRLWFLGDRWFSVSKYSTLALARQIMPESGFNWIAEDLPTYKMWLEALIGEGDEDENKLIKFLTMTDPGGAGGGKKLPGLVLKPEHPKATTEGDEFLEWLMDGIENGTITTNQSDSMVYVLGTGELFLVTPLIFNEFLRQHPSNIQWDQVADQFSKLGLTDNLKDGKVNFEKIVVQGEKKSGSGSQAPSGWGASHFSSKQQSSSTATKVTADQMVHEGVAVQALGFTVTDKIKSDKQQVIRQHTEVQKAQESKEQKALDKLMQTADQKVSFQTTR